MRVKMSRIRLRIDLGLVDGNELPARVGLARRPLLAPRGPTKWSSEFVPTQVRAMFPVFCGLRASTNTTRHSGFFNFSDGLKPGCFISFKSNRTRARAATHS